MVLDSVYNYLKKGKRLSASGTGAVVLAHRANAFSTSAAIESLLDSHPNNEPDEGQNFSGHLTTA